MALRRTELRILHTTGIDHDAVDHHRRIGFLQMERVLARSRDLECRRQFFDALEQRRAPRGLIAQSKPERRRASASTRSIAFKLLVRCA